MRKLTLLIILVAAAAVVLPQEMRMPMPKTSSAQSDAQKAFEKLKTLAGSWQGSVMGMSVQATIRVTSRGWKSGQSDHDDLCGRRPAALDALL